MAQPGPGKLVPYRDAALRLFETLVRAVDLKDRYTHDKILNRTPNLL